MLSRQAMWFLVYVHLFPCLLSLQVHFYAFFYWYAYSIFEFRSFCYRFDLGEYVVERGAYGSSVLGWYHRRFWEEARRRYAASHYYEDLDPSHRARRTRRGLPENVRKEQHARRLQQYFSGQLERSYPDRGSYYLGTSSRQSVNQDFHISVQRKHKTIFSFHFQFLLKI